MSSSDVLSIARRLERAARRRFRPLDIDLLTSAELYAEARRLGVPGRSQMNKRELAQAVRQARGRRHFPHSLQQGATTRLNGRATMRVDGRRAARERPDTTKRFPALATLPLASRILPAARDASGARRAALVTAIVGLCGGLGLLVAVLFVPDEGSSTLVQRVHNGVTETGEVETVTTPTSIKRVIRWRTRQGKIVTETIHGPLRVTTLNGQTFYLAGPTQTRLGTTTLPSGTVVVTTPGATLIQTVVETQTLPAVTETVRDTVTEVVTVHDTVTVVETVTEIVPQVPAGTGP